jgi:hypothetical protein
VFKHSSKAKEAAMQCQRDNPNGRRNRSRASEENATGTKSGNHEKPWHIIAVFYLSLLTNVV